MGALGLDVYAAESEDAADCSVEVSPFLSLFLTVCGNDLCSVIRVFVCWGRADDVAHYARVEGFILDFPGFLLT